jgi:DNA repair protein RadC
MMKKLTKAGDKYNTTNELLKMFLGVGITEQNPKT